MAKKAKTRNKAGGRQGLVRLCERISVLSCTLRKRCDAWGVTDAHEAAEEIGAKATRLANFIIGLLPEDWSPPLSRARAKVAFADGMPLAGGLKVIRVMHHTLLVEDGSGARDVMSTKDARKIGVAPCAAP